MQRKWHYLSVRIPPHMMARICESCRINYGKHASKEAFRLYKLGTECEEWLRGVRDTIAGV
jgi:hypothetical protein